MEGKSELFRFRVFAIFWVFGDKLNEKCSAYSLLIKHRNRRCRSTSRAIPSMALRKSHFCFISIVQHATSAVFCIPCVFVIFFFVSLRTKASDDFASSDFEFLFNSLVRCNSAMNHVNGACAEALIKNGNFQKRQFPPSATFGPTRWFTLTESFFWRFWRAPGAVRG